MFGLIKKMRAYKTFIAASVLTTIGVFILFFLFGCSHINERMGLEDDNIYEEVGEFILDQYGIEVDDLTPDTPEI